MGFSDAIRTVLAEKYATFSGRAPRSEYWWFVVFYILLSLALGLVGAVSDALSSILGVLAWLVLLIPSLAVGVRRLHDIDRTGWWLLIGLVPLVGTVVLLVFFLLPGTPGANRFGAAPLGDAVRRSA